MKAQTALKSSQIAQSSQLDPMNSLIMSQDRMPHNQPQLMPANSSAAIKKRKQQNTEFRKTSNGPLSRKTAYQLNNAFLGNSANRAKSSMNKKSTN